ncbi:MAG: rhodanese-like domain-containing protein, partial [Deltaproteobacteria bacterium]|nr:rhodanese-like domain-containing protein [Deltaproteobacteria bacterium]
MDIPQIQIHEAKQKLDQRACTFVDIRDPGSYRAAHIPGALHLHDGNVQEFLQSADKETPVIVYCYHPRRQTSVAEGYFHETDRVSQSSGALSGGNDAVPQSGLAYQPFIESA